jgi:hypothetical protein
MAVNYDTLFPGTPKGQGTKFVAADGTAEKDITGVAPAEGMVILAISLTQNSAIARQVILYANDGSTSYRLGTKVLAASAGASATPADDLLSTIAMTWIRTDISNNPQIVLPVGFKLRASMGAALDASNDCTIYVEYGDFTKQP